MMRRNCWKGECSDEADGDVEVFEDGHGGGDGDTFGFCALVFAVGA